jgi:RNA polymerase sigma-70 factor (ECF subfamily)
MTPEDIVQLTAQGGGSGEPLRRLAAGRVPRSKSGDPFGETRSEKGSAQGGGSGEPLRRLAAGRVPRSQSGDPFGETRSEKGTACQVPSDGGRATDRLGDAALVEGIAKDDEGALAVVIDGHAPAVYALARRLVGDPTVAEEVTQDTFMALWNRPEAFDEGFGSLRAFVLGIARKKAIDAWRKETGRARLRANLTSAVAADHTQDHLARKVGARIDLENALSRLSHRQREAIRLAYYLGFTYKEVAQNLGIPEGTAKTRLREGLVRLRRILAPA